MKQGLEGQVRKAVVCTGFRWECSEDGGCEGEEMEVFIKMPFRA